MSELAASATSPVSDGELLAEVRAGNVSSLESLYDRYAGYVHALALRIVDSSEEAEEITQDVFWQVWKKKLLYDPERGRFSTWLFAVTRTVRSTGFDRHAAGRKWRRSRSKKRHRPAITRRTPRILPSGDSTSDGRSRGCRRHNSKPSSFVFFQGMTHREVAARLDEPLGTVKSRIKMGMDKLKQSLASSGELR